MLFFWFSGFLVFLHQAYVLRTQAFISRVESLQTLGFGVLVVVISFFAMT
jgi:hypothetical protein